MKGMTIELGVKTEVGVDPFGKPIYETNYIEVEDVLVGQPSSEDLISTLDLTGKRIAYVLGIPKGDEHVWEDTTVRFWGKTFRTIGYPETGIQENIPLRWGQNVKVEAYG